MAKKKKEQSKFWDYTGLGALHLLKSPYYLGKGIYRLSRKAGEYKEERQVRKSRESIKPKFKEFDILESIDGKYADWAKKVLTSDSQIGVILGARGSGKSAFGMKFLENLHYKSKKKCFALGFQAKDLPSWINSIDDVSQIGNNSYVLVDEGGILFSSRSSMSSANKMLSNLILISRHKNLSIFFITQNSSNLEINVLRQADFLVLKPSSLLQKEFERKIIQKMYDGSKEHFEKHRSDPGLAYIYSGNFRGFVSNPLPSFWKQSLSKSFREK